MKNRIKIINGTFIILIFLASCQQGIQNTDDITLKTRMDTISYIIGLDYGTSISDEQIAANQEAIYKGLADGLAGKSVLSDSIKNKLIEEFNVQLEQIKKKKEEEVLFENKKAGADFMKENMTKEGVIILPSGLQYKVFKEGEGTKPQVSDSVQVHYRAMFIDGSVFDMSYDRGPAGIRLKNIIPGLSEGIRQMNPGAIFEFYIPPKLAYGDKAFAKIIPAGTTLIYSVELIKIY